MIEIGKNPNTNEPIYFPTESQTGECSHIGIFGGPGFGKSFLLKKKLPISLRILTPRHLSLAQNLNISNLLKKPISNSVIYSNGE